MRKKAVAGIVGACLLSGCLPAMPDGNGTASYTWNDRAVLNVGSKVLIGQMTTILGTVQTGSSYFRSIQQLQVSDGYLTCTTPLNEKWGGGAEGSFEGSSYITDVSCSDGSTGKMQVASNKWKEDGFANHGYSGVGTGRLSNGTGLRLTFGPSINLTNSGF